MWWFEDINLFVQSDNFAYQRWNGMYAPLGIGFLEIIAEQKPAIPLYRTSMCEVPEDSIILHQYPFDINIIELEYKAFKSKLYPEELRDFWVVYTSPSRLVAKQRWGILLSLYRKMGHINALELEARKRRVPVHGGAT